ncbi:MAG TPA: alpha/beta fold hydrolase [Bacteroidota bacterium]|nr:alpha/beta fold hydrolase [Bacteroidota bacterium]
MKQVILVTIAVLVFVLPGCKPKTDYREVKQYTIEQFMKTVSIRGASFSHDEKLILFSSNQSGIFNAYSVPVQGGSPTQITHSTTNAIYAVSFFPLDNRILYQSDNGGNEIFHLYVRNEDGVETDLTPGPDARSQFYGWSHDNRSFFYGSNKRDPKFMDVYEMDLATFTPRMLYRNDAGYDFGDISNDRRFIAFSKTYTNDNADMYVYDLEARELKLLSAHKGDIVFMPQAFSTDCQWLYYLTDEASEFTCLKRYELATGTTERVESGKWDITSASISFNGRYRVVVVNEDAKTKVEVTDSAGKPVELPSLADLDVASVNFSRGDGLMALFANSSRSSTNLYVYDFASGTSRALTNTMNAEINPDDLVTGQVVRYKSFDGTEIPAIQYKPHQIKPEDRAPALVWVHGGPGGQSRLNYSPLIQYLVNHGYVVTAVNNRGSSGYGKSFYRADDQKHGDVDLKDCVEAKKYLAATGYVDTNRIGIIGGSYGGYMVLAGLAFQPKEFAVGVDIFGVANWIRTLKSIPPWWEAYRLALYREMGDPATQEEMLKSISPLFHASNIFRPLIVLQGANDPRVLKVESDEMVAAVRKNGVPVEYIVFPDEGHGFAKKTNEIQGDSAILKFLDQYLKGGSPFQTTAAQTTSN